MSRIIINWLFRIFLPSDYNWENIVSFNLMDNLKLVEVASIKAHNDWITNIDSSIETIGGVMHGTVLTSSRDKTMLVWSCVNDNSYIKPMKSLEGHGGGIQDCCLSNDSQYALSASWDKSLRLWDLTKGQEVRQFNGHTSDVFTCAFSSDNRQIISGSRDHSMRLWNTLAECKYTFEEAHSDWVTCIRFSPDKNSTLLISCGWDKVAKVWNIETCANEYDLAGHKGVLSTVAISPDGSLCASGGRDGLVFLWDGKGGKFLSHLTADSPINSLSFNPAAYYLSAATDTDIKVWQLAGKSEVVAEFYSDKKENNTFPWCSAIKWSKDGNTLLAGTTDGYLKIYTWQ